MKKGKVSLIILLYTFILSCQVENRKEEPEKEERLTKSEMIEDFSLFRSIYQQANSGLYKYRTKEEIDSIFQVSEKKITNSTSYRQFYNILWSIVEFTGSCHSFLDYPDSLDERIKEQKLFFPVPLKYINQKVYTNCNHDLIPGGSEVLSINGIDIKEFVSLTSRYGSTDGFNKSGKYIEIEADWYPFNIYLAFGRKDSFQINFLQRDSSIKEVQLPSVSYKNFIENYENRLSKEFEERYDKTYSFHYLDSIQAGMLQVNSFIIGGTNSKEHKKYAAFLDSVFMHLNATKTANLIVDIRTNEGGIDPNDILLYSYLTKRKFKENKGAFTIFKEVPLKKYYLPAYENEISDLEENLKEEFTIANNGAYYQNDHFNRIWMPNKNSYKGNIILLIDPYVASAGSLFASMVKSDEGTVVIGEETLGGYYGHTGHIPVSYQLPNSGLILTFSIVDLEQDVKPLADEKYGDGVKPDIKVFQSYQDFLENKDTQLNYAIELIKATNKTQLH